MELVQWQMQSIYGLALHSHESNQSSRWSLIDLVHMATCSIHWAILWSAESIKIRQNQGVNFDEFGVCLRLIIHLESLDWDFMLYIVNNI